MHNRCLYYYKQIEYYCSNKQYLVGNPKSVNTNIYQSYIRWLNKTSITLTYGHLPPTFFSTFLSTVETFITFA